MMIAVLSALLAVFPGSIIVTLLDARSRSIGARVSDAIVWSLLLLSVAAWMPGGANIPFTLWVWFALGAAALGAGSAVWTAFTEKPSLHTGNLAVSLLRLLSYGAIACFAVMLMTRAIVDWDAITYYLPPALDFVLSGHVAAYLSPYVTTAAHAPNTQPPIMPILYALAIGVASIFHGKADESIRLFALVFIVGTWLSARRIAGHYLPPVLKEGAGVLYLLLPATIAAVASNSLYLDLGFTFLTTALIAEIVCLKQNDRFSWLRLAAIASAIVLFKINGLPFVALVTLAVAIARMPVIWSRFAAALTALAMVVISAHFGFFEGVGTPSLWISIAVVSALLIYCAQPCVAPIRINTTTAILGLVGLIPAILHVVKMTEIVGSPAGYYVPQLTRVSTPHWHQALSILNKVPLYAASAQPGLPEHFGPGLLLWWGFAPVVALCALIGLLLAGYKRHPILQIASTVLLFALAFLTVFRLDDFRHLLPVTPLITVLAMYAVYQVVPAERRIHSILVLVASAVPFCWVAQQRFFAVPLSLLTPLGWDQWHALSLGAFVNIAIYCLAILLFGSATIILRPVDPRNARPIERWATSYAATAICSVVAILCIVFLHAVGAAVLVAAAGAALAYPKLRRRGLTLVAAALLLGSVFLPLVSTALTPGFRAQASQVSNDEDGGYLAVLLPALHEWDARLLLTYKSYGITWFSVGHARRIDLTDASDLGRIEDVLDRRDPARAIKLLGIDGTIFPTRNGPEWPAFQDLLATGHLAAIPSLNDPLLSEQISNENWSYRRLFPLTQPAHLKGDLQILSERAHASISDQDISPSHGWNAIAVDSRDFRSPDVRVSIQATVLTPDGNERLTQTELPAPGGKIFLRDVRNGLNARQDALIDMRCIAFSIPRKNLTASFRSEGLEIRQNANSFDLVRGAPMILHAEYGLVESISSVDIRGDKLHYFPAPTEGKFDGGPFRLMFQLRSNDFCPAGSRLGITLSGTLITRDKKAPFSTTFGAFTEAHATLDVSARIPRPSGTSADFVFGNIMVQGVRNDCRVAETIEPESFSVRISSNGSAAIDVVPALPFHVRSVTL